MVHGCGSIQIGKLFDVHQHLRQVRPHALVLFAPFRRNAQYLALVVEGTDPDALAERLTEAGVEIESRSEKVIGAQGSGEALYVRDPDGYLIELKLYDVESGDSRDE